MSKISLKIFSLLACCLTTGMSCTACNYNGDSRTNSIIPGSVVSMTQPENFYSSPIPKLQMENSNFSIIPTKNPENSQVSATQKARLETLCELVESFGKLLENRPWILEEKYTMLRENQRVLRKVNRLLDVYLNNAQMYQSAIYSGIANCQGKQVFSPKWNYILRNVGLYPQKPIINDNKESNNKESNKKLSEFLLLINNLRFVQTKILSESTEICNSIRAMELCPISYICWGLSVLSNISDNTILNDFVTKYLPLSMDWLQLPIWSEKFTYILSCNTTQLGLIDHANIYPYFALFFESASLYEKRTKVLDCNFKAFQTDLWRMYNNIPVPECQKLLVFNIFTLFLNARNTLLKANKDLHDKLIQKEVCAINEWFDNYNSISNLSINKVKDLNYRLKEFYTYVDKVTIVLNSVERFDFDQMKKDLNKNDSNETLVVNKKMKYNALKLRNKDNTIQINVNNACSIYEIYKKYKEQLQSTVIQLRNALSRPESLIIKMIAAEPFKGLNKSKTEIVQASEFVVKLALVDYCVKLFSNYLKYEQDRKTFSDYTDASSEIFNLLKTIKPFIRFFRKPDFTRSNLQSALIFNIQNL